MRNHEIEALTKLPHPIPYQGSKRNLAKQIGKHIPEKIDVWFEPFAGSAAMTLWASYHNKARFFVISDALAPLAELWRSMINQPHSTARRYREIWSNQKWADKDYFNEVRGRYNDGHDPVDLLYLTCRCVKNAVRFNSSGRFTQSVDRRRLGMHPDKMDQAISGAANLLYGRSEVRSGDWLDTTTDASSDDFVYLDPPYLGTTIGRDRRYVQQVEQDALTSGLKCLSDRRVKLALSYDGMTGAKTYGPPLPPDLGLFRLFLHAGRSSQATLSGRSEETIESLYLSNWSSKMCNGAFTREQTTQEFLAI